MNKETYYQAYICAMHKALSDLLVTDQACRQLTAQEGFDRWRDWTWEVKAQGRTCYFVGNGASAMMASHMAVDGTKNAGVNSLAFNDPAFLTAIGNDLSYEEVFSFPLQRFGRPGDLLVTISSSGNSPNVVRAIGCAREVGLRVITLSSMKSDNKSRAQGDLNFYIPAKTYGVAESSHAILLHCWLDYLLNVREWESV